MKNLLAIAAAVTAMVWTVTPFMGSVSEGPREDMLPKFTSSVPEGPREEILPKLASVPEGPREEILPVLGAGAA